MTRRDHCYQTGERAAALSPGQAQAAWYFLAEGMIDMGEMDMPKFWHLFARIREGTRIAETLDPNLQITKST